MSEDGFLALAAKSARVKQEHRLLLEGLKAFERKLIELVGELVQRGVSHDIVLDEFLDDEDEPIGHTLGYLGFDGAKLYVASRDVPHPPWDDGYTASSIETVSVDWQRRLSDHAVLSSLIDNLAGRLDTDIAMTAPVVASLGQFVALEKAQIDADIDGQFQEHPFLLESWIKARKAVVLDPELSITLSCSHIETVLKKCLKVLGSEGYEHDPIERLMSRVLRLLREKNTVDDATLQMLSGVGTICHGVGTIRNRKSVAHGQNEGYVQPTASLAQTLNHLAGVVSVFVIRQVSSLSMQKTGSGGLG